MKFKNLRAGMIIEDPTAPDYSRYSLILYVVPNNAHSGIEIYNVGTLGSQRPDFFSPTYMSKCLDYVEADVKPWKEVKDKKRPRQRRRCECCKELSSQYNIRNHEIVVCYDCKYEADSEKFR